VNFLTNHYSGVPSLNLPIGTNTSSTNAVQILDAPPAGEDTNSLISKQRLYNKADLIINITKRHVHQLLPEQRLVGSGVIVFTNSFAYTNSSTLAVITNKTTVTNLFTDGTTYSYTTNFHQHLRPRPLEHGHPHPFLAEYQ